MWVGDFFYFEPCYFILRGSLYNELLVLKCCLSMIFKSHFLNGGQKIKFINTALKQLLEGKLVCGLIKQDLC